MQRPQNRSPACAAVGAPWQKGRWSYKGPSIPTACLVPPLFPFTPRHTHAALPIFNSVLPAVSALWTTRRVTTGTLAFSAAVHLPASPLHRLLLHLLGLNESSFTLTSGCTRDNRGLCTFRYITYPPHLFTQKVVSLLLPFAGPCPHVVINPAQARVSRFKLHPPRRCAQTGRFSLSQADILHSFHGPLALSLCGSLFLACLATFKCAHNQSTHRCTYQREVHPNPLRARHVGGQRARVVVVELGQ
jgi:hypothetical protein